MKAPRQCPVCGSADWQLVNEWHEGFSFWKALIGSWVLGNRIGLWAGFLGKNNRLYRCRACNFAMRYHR